MPPKQKLTSITTKSRGPKLSDAQKGLMCQWLENRANFALIVGNAAEKDVVAGTELKKRDAYKKLAEFMNQYKTDLETSWTVKNAETRYRSYFKSYK